MRKRAHPQAHHHVHHPQPQHIPQHMQPPPQQQQQPQPKLEPYTLSPDPQRRYVTNGATSSKLDGVYADVFPRTAGEDESLLTETTIRNGIICAHPLISIDSLSAFEVYKDKLNEDMIGALKRITGSFELNASKVVSGATTFKPPVVNRLSRPDEWMALLLSKEPLDKLTSSFPNTFQPLPVLLPEIFKNQPSIPRAVWFIKCTLLNAASENGVSVFTDFMKKYLLALLEKIARSSAGATPPTVSAKVKGARGDQPMDGFRSAEQRHTFISSWLYGVEFVSHCYTEGLLDGKTMLAFCVDHINFKKTSFVQMNLMIPLLWNLIGDLVKSRHLTRFLLDAIIPRAKLIQDLCSSSNLIAIQYSNLVFMVQYVAIAAPDAFLSPLWTDCEMLRKDIFRGSPDTTLQSMPQEMRTSVLRGLADLEKSIEGRIQQMRYQIRKGPERPVSVNVMNIQDSEALNISELMKRWFTLDTPTSSNLLQASISDRVDELVNWALLPVDLGGKWEYERRVYLVSSVLLEFIKADQTGAARGQIQLILMDILNKFAISWSNAMTDDNEERNQVIWLFGDFVRMSLNEQYSQLFLGLPVYEHGSHISNTRLELRNENDREEDNEAERTTLLKAKHLLKLLLPQVFSNAPLEDAAGLGVSSDPASAWSEFVSLQPFMNLFTKCMLAKWIQQGYEVYVVKSVAINAENWKKQISSLATGSSLLTPAQYMILITVFDQMLDIRSILELNLWLITSKADKKLNPFIIDTFRKYINRFRYMGELDKIAVTLWTNKKSFIISSNIYENRFIMFLSSLRNSLEPANMAKWDEFVLESQLPHTTSNDNVSEFSDIRTLKDNEESIASAISNLSFRYGFNKAIVKRIFHYSIQFLSKFAADNSAELTRRRAQITVKVLQGLNHHGRFLDEHVGEYLDCCFEAVIPPASAAVVSAIKEPWILAFLLELLLSNCCSVETLVFKLVVPGIVHQFGSSKPDSAPRFLNVASVLNALLVSNSETSPVVDVGGLSPSSMEMHSLDAIRGSSLQRQEVFSALFDCVFKLCTIRDRFESTLTSVATEKPQDQSALSDSLRLMKQTIEFVTSVSWFKVLIECNSAFIRENRVVPWVVSQKDLATACMAPTKSQKKQTNPATISRKTSKGFTFLRQAFTRPGDLMLDMSVDRTALCELIEKMLSGANESNYELRKFLLFLMFEEVSVLSILKTESRLSEGYEELVFSLVAEKLLQTMKESWNYWLYQIIPELPVPVLIMLLKLGQERIEASLNAVSFSTLSPEDFAGIESLVEVCCYAASVLVDLAVAGKGKSAKPDLVSGCVGLYNSIVVQLEWFLEKAENINQIEVVGRTTPEAPQSLLGSTSDVIFMTKFRTSLLVRLRVLGTLMPFVINRLDICNPLRTVECLILLSVSNLADNCEAPIGDIVLDHAVYILEAPESTKHPDLKGVKLAQELQPKLVFRKSMIKRLGRIMPFQFDSIYLKNLVSTMDLTKYPSSMPRDLNLIWNPIKHYDPLNWLESRSFALDLSTEVGLSPPSDACEGEASVKDVGRIKNDTPISLSLFGASASVQSSLYEQLKKKGGWKQPEVVDHVEIKRRSKLLCAAVLRHRDGK
ncbi:RNA polymerase II mediator complex subunit [Podochytrium sp. JEL0797]|nr:RNA polymerase II mediator complex subunit [Podochytrium sp. JEL0797]